MEIEGLGVEELARRFGTPLYVVSEARLRANARAWSAALAAAWPGPTELLPSLKANTIVALRRILNEEGLGCDCFGRNELALALHAGVPAGAISVNGATKGDDVLELAIGSGARLTLDSLDELARAQAIAERLGVVAPVRLRLRPWLAASDARSDFSPEPYPAHLAVHDYRAGMAQADARSAVLAAEASTSLDLVGVMAHVSRHTTALSFWAALGAEMAALIADLRSVCPQWTPREVDLGGGFAVPRDPTARLFGARADAPAAPSPAEYLAAMTGPLAAGLDSPENVVLQIEPGRAIYGDAGVHLTTVRHIKRQTEPVERVWIETDTSEVFLADTFIESNGWTIEGFGADGPLVDAAVTGISCGWDVLAPPAPRVLPRPGELLAFLDTGAYQDACASNFNAMCRPATVLVSGTDARVVRRAETFADLLAREQA
jgi:diaminopimelate decarboxylase